MTFSVDTQALHEVVAMLVIYFVVCLIDHTLGLFDPTEHENWKFLDNELCGDSTASRIIGGLSAGLGELPWIARIGYAVPGEEETDYRCGGAILNERTVLTAAHCVYNLPAGLTIKSVVLGELNEKTDPDCENDVCGPPIQSIRPMDIIYHSKYNTPPFQNDIALIKLEKDITFNAYVRPVCMVRGSLLQKNFAGEMAEVAGWGFTDITTKERSHVLLKVNVKVQENDACVKGFERFAPIGPKQTCAGGEVGKDSCGGDSGGPLTIVAAENGPPRVYAIGIVSFGVTRCGTSTTPGVYTRLTSYLDWILDNLKANKRDYKLV